MKNTHKLYTDVIAKSGSKNKPLEVTENGIYEAPKGTGYSPVKVNVPQTAESGTVKALLDATQSANHLFYNYRSKSVNGLISFNDTANVTDMSYMFNKCYNLTTIPALYTSNVTNMTQMFRDCSSLNTIPALDASNVTNMSGTFDYCYRLASIGLYGFTRSIRISDTSLGHDDLVAFLNQAGTAYNSSQKITMGADKLALLSDEEKAIATNKGWTLA